MKCQGLIKLKVFYHPAENDILYGSNVRNKIVVKGRRFGLTKTFANYAIEQMLVEKVSPVLWVDTINSNIDRYVDRYFIPVLRDLPSSMWKWRSHKKELKINGSALDMRSADNPENIEGFGYKLVLLNEAGIILKDPYLWHNTIRPMMMDFGAPILAGGTPKGKGLFFDLAQMEHKDPENWKTYKYTTYDNPFIPKAEIDSIASDMPDLVRRQEIFADFLEDEASVFRGIDACIAGELEDPKPGQRYIAGLDLAKHVDWTVCAILDSKRHLVFFGRIQQKDWGYQKKWVTENLTRYNNAETWVDSTGVGDAIYDDLRRSGLNVKSYKFTSQSKRDLVEALMISIEQKQITFPAIRVLLSELKSFEYVMSANGPKYSAPEGMHDDCVMGLALANYGAKTGRAPSVDFI